MTPISQIKRRCIFPFLHLLKAEKFSEMCKLPSAESYFDYHPDYYAYHDEEGYYLSLSKYLPEKGQTRFSMLAAVMEISRRK